MTTKNIIKALNDLTSDQLLELNSEISKVYKKRQMEELSIIKSAIKVGDTVKVNHPKAHGKKFKIYGINRTKAVLKPSHLTEMEAILHGKTVVPISLIQPINA